MVDIATWDKQGDILEAYAEKLRKKVSTGVNRVSTGVSTDVSDPLKAVKQVFWDDVKSSVNTVNRYKPKSTGAEINPNGIKAYLETNIFNNQALTIEPLGEDAPGEFPLHLFPKWSQDLALTVSESLQVPLDMPGSFLLTAIGGAIQGKLCVEAVDGYRQPPNLYMLLVAKPSEKKSPVFRVMLHPFFSWEKEKRAELASKVKKEQAIYRTWQAALKRAEEAASKDFNNRELQNAIEELISCEPSVTALPRLIVSDTTPEALSELFSIHKNLVISDSEGGFIGTLAGRYSGGNPNLDLFCKAYDGDEVRTHRVGREDVTENPLATVALTVQPAILSEIRECKRFKEQGALSRFCVIMPGSEHIGHRDTSLRPINQEAVDKYNSQIKALLDYEVRDINGKKSKSPKILKLTSAARHLFIEDRKRREPDFLPGGLSDGIEDWYGKQDGRILRLALIIEVAHKGTKATEVSVESMQSAILLSRYLLTHYLKATEIMRTTDGVKGLANHIVRWAAENKMPLFTRRDAQRRLARTIREPRELDAALTILVQHGYAFACPKLPVNGCYVLNPFIYQKEPKTVDTVDTKSKTPAIDLLSHVDTGVESVLTGVDEALTQAAVASEGHRGRI